MTLPHSGDYLHEKIEYADPLLCMQIFEISYPRLTKTTYGSWHYHEQIEFLAVLEGTIAIETTDREFALRAGDVAIIGSSQVHRSRKSGPQPLRYLVLQLDLTPYFDPSTVAYISVFSETRSPLTELNYIFAEAEPARQEAFASIGRLYDLMRARGRGYELGASALIKQLLWLLVREDSRGVLPAVDLPELIRLQPVLDYIERNLPNRITVEDVAPLLHVSYHHFIKLFKQTMGIAFTDYLHLKRIKRAERLLLTKDVNVADAGEAVGFPNSAQFHKIFRRYSGCSPKQFRDNRLQPNAGDTLL